MNIQIISESENKLLNRKEIKARITFEGVTPNRDTIKKAMKLKGNIIIRKIMPEYGKSAAIVEAISYPDKKSIELMEPKHVQKKNIKEEPKMEALEKEE